ncbi:MAG TPA: preprotein translocase subunit SecG [Candidatus Polarisedimenticolaceae bacterium]|nr:preprotein translocase subunit SecG [Candidatus Polarisedimenticolaceae bacterium]
MLGVLLTIVHVIVAVFLIMVVLLQTGKKADLAGAFGGGGSQTAFGTRGAATLLSKLTTVAAVSFMLTSLALSLIASNAVSQKGGSVLPEDTPTSRSEQVPPPSTPGSPVDQPAGEDAGSPPADNPGGAPPTSDDEPPPVEGPATPD